MRLNMMAIGSHQEAKPCSPCSSVETSVIPTLALSLLMRWLA